MKIYSMMLIIYFNIKTCGAKVAAPHVFKEIVLTNFYPSMMIWRLINEIQVCELFRASDNQRRKSKTFMLHAIITVCPAETPVKRFIKVNTAIVMLIRFLGSSAQMKTAVGFKTGVEKQS